MNHDKIWEDLLYREIELGTRWESGESLPFSQPRTLKVRNPKSKPEIRYGAYAIITPTLTHTGGGLWTTAIGPITGRNTSKTK